MQLVTSFTGQRALFDPDDHSTQTTQTTTARDRSASESSPAPTRPDSTSRPDRPTLAGDSASCPDDSLLSLMRSGPAKLRQKRAKASQSQRGKHETSCRAFDSFWQQYVTPVLQTGVTFTLDAIRADSEHENPNIRRDFALYWLGQKTKAGKPLSAQTVATYWQHVCMVCRAYSIHLQQFTRDELDLLRRDNQKSDATPQIVVIERRCPTATELDAICQHATAARSVYGSHAPYLIRFLTRLLSCYGLRTNDVFSTKPGKLGLRKQDILWAPECPDPNVNAALGYTLLNPCGWMWIRIHKSEKKHVAMMLLPIPPWARGPLQFFCELSPHAEMVFPSFDPDSRCTAAATFAKDWNAVIAAAKVNPSIRLSEGRGGVIAIRKYSYNWWRLTVQKKHADVALAKDVAAYIMHHAEITKSTADRHYAVVRATVLPVIVGLLAEFPKPAADALPVSLLPE